LTSHPDLAPNLKKKQSYACSSPRRRFIAGCRVILTYIADSIREHFLPSDPSVGQHAILPAHTASYLLSFTGTAAPHSSASRAASGPHRCAPDSLAPSPDNIKCHLFWPLHRPDLRRHSVLSLDGIHNAKFASQPLSNRMTVIMAGSGC
jgi:hypothetical protein